jgi:chlorobactene glucosyltransferase
MISALAVYAAATLLEIGLWSDPLWRLRKPIAWAVSLGLMAGGIWLFLSGYTFGSILLLLVSAYRVVNQLRIVKGRMDPPYLRRVVTRTGLQLIILQLFIGLSWWLCVHYDITLQSFWIVFSGLQLLGVLVLVASTERHLRTTLPPSDIAAQTHNQLPTLTVAIPARNETDDLQTCLESLIASDYPKLEILVLDDCSQNSRTPEIIREFAHAGVRFLQGQPTKDGWLAKNQAYQQLLDAANGELVLFTGVDTRYRPDSLRRLVASMIDKKKSMVSVIPANQVQSFGAQDESILLQPARYAWELALPRKLFNRPPVLSTCWLISRKMLKSAGGFAAVSRSIVPESYFARVAIVHDGYSFMQSNEDIGIISAKKSAQQFDTAVRTRYPQLHRRPELVLVITLAEAFGLVMPFIVLAAKLLLHPPIFSLVVSVLTCLLILYFYGRIVCLTYRKFLLRAFVAAPFAAVLDMVVLNYSMAKYEFAEVIWKGRNVCIPVMRAIPSLPKVDEAAA